MAVDQGEPLERAADVVGGVHPGVVPLRAAWARGRGIRAGGRVRAKARIAAQVAMPSSFAVGVEVPDRVGDHSRQAPGAAP